VALCPHCKVNTIGVHAKAWSSAASPARCPACEGLSYISNPHGTAMSRAAVFVPLAAIVVLVITGSPGWSVGVVAVLVAWGIACEARAFYRTPMIAIDRGQVPAARLRERLGLVILAVGVSVVVLLFWGARGL